MSVAHAHEMAILEDTGAPRSKMDTRPSPGAPRSKMGGGPKMGPSGRSRTNSDAGYNGSLRDLEESVADHDTTIGQLIQAVQLVFELEEAKPADVWDRIKEWLASRIVLYAEDIVHAELATAYDQRAVRTTTQKTILEACFACRFACKDTRRDEELRPNMTDAMLLELVKMIDSGAVQPGLPSQYQYLQRVIDGDPYGSRTRDVKVVRAEQRLAREKHEEKETKKAAVVKMVRTLFRVETPAEYKARKELPKIPW